MVTRRTLRLARIIPKNHQSYCGELRKKSLARIPLCKTGAEFAAFVKAGRKLGNAVMLRPSALPETHKDPADRFIIVTILFCNLWLAVIDALHNTRNFSIHALCDALDVKRGTYYNYAKRGKVRTGEIWYVQRKGELVKAVERVFNESKQRFGAQKIVDVLKTEGIASTQGSSSPIASARQTARV